MASSIGQPIDAAASARGGAPAGIRPETAPQTVTFLFTDVEGSTRLWEQFPTAMKQALERHDAILTGAIRGSNGEIVKATGDGMMAVFGSAIGALNASIAAQHALLDEPWPVTPEFAMSLNAAFGGANTALVIGLP